jgi:hypothetical protein
MDKLLNEYPADEWRDDVIKIIRRIKNENKYDTRSSGLADDLSYAIDMYVDCFVTAKDNNAREKQYKQFEQNQPIMAKIQDLAFDLDKDANDEQKWQELVDLLPGIETGEDEPRLPRGLVFDSNFTDGRPKNDVSSDAAFNEETGWNLDVEIIPRFTNVEMTYIRRVKIAPDDVCYFYTDDARNQYALFETDYFDGADEKADLISGGIGVDFSRWIGPVLKKKESRELERQGFKNPTQPFIDRDGFYYALAEVSGDWNEVKDYEW